MMREIVDDGDPVHLRLHFQPPLHTLESLEGGLNRVLRDAASGSHRSRRRGVADVVLTGKAKFQVHTWLAALQIFPRGSRRLKTQVHNSPLRNRLHTVA